MSNGISYVDDKQIASVWCEKRYSDKPRIEIKLLPIGENMVEEHALHVSESISLDELNYLIKKANRLGRMDRDISYVYEQDDIDGRHIYFEVDELKPKKINEDDS